MRMRGTILRAVGAIAVALIFASGTLAAPLPFSDNFNDGNDDGWSHYSPLDVVLAPASYSFPNGGYRIQAPTSPSPGTIGPARGGAYRADIVQTDFHIEVDIVDWNNNVAQGMSIGARANDLALGIADGYAFGFGLGSGQFANIQRFDNEVTDVLVATTFVADPNEDYRLIFTGVGDQLSGEIYALSDLGTPLVSLNASDAVYTSGYPGLLVAGVVGAANGPVDATFDNFYVAPEPGALGLLALGALVLGRRFRR